MLATHGLESGFLKCYWDWLVYWRKSLHHYNLILCPRFPTSLCSSKSKSCLLVPLRQKCNVIGTICWKGIINTRMVNKYLKVCYPRLSASGCHTSEVTMATSVTKQCTQNRFGLVLFSWRLQAREIKRLTDFTCENIRKSGKRWYFTTAQK